MLLEQTISITAGRGTTKVLRSAGIDFEMGKTYEVPVDKLSETSHYSVRLVCDYCGAEYLAKLSDRNRNLGRSIVKKDCCQTCQPQKTAEQCRLRHGVDWPTKRPEVQESWKQTNLERYGVENVSQTQSVKDKKLQVFMSKYGEPCYLCTPEGREKSHQTFVEHYGEDPYNNPCIKQRRAQTCLEKYGFSCSAQSPAVREKIRNTLLERYGVENPMGVPEFAERARTNRSDPGWVVSKPQRAMYDSLIAMGYDAYLEHHVPWGWFDVAVFLPDGQRLDFEYDGRFWHSSDEQRERDRRRDLASFADGWKVARFRGDESPPSEKEIEDALTALIDNNQQFYTVELAG